MSSGSPSPYDGEIAEQFDMSPEISPLPPPLSRLEFSKVSRKKLNFEEVGQLLELPADKQRKSMGKVPDKGADRLETDASERVSQSQTSKLNALARGYSNASEKDKTKRGSKTLTQPSVSTSAAKRKGTSSASVKVPSKTPPAIRRHSETTTPHIHPRPLTSLSNPEWRKGDRISNKFASSGGQKTLGDSHPALDKQASTTGESRKRPSIGHGSSPSSESSISDPEPPSKRSSIESQLTKILQEVQRANTRLDSYDDKFDSLQERLQKLEEKPTSSSVSSSDASMTKRKVPPEVRVSTCMLSHLVYIPGFYSGFLSRGRGKSNDCQFWEGGGG